MIPGKPAAPSAWAFTLNKVMKALAKAAPQMAAING
ncbi:Uncharacterised protein [Vibrio cholerae]|uniref:Uncharacterized protein n=1 Tax=Vibrio cholerae TaxID=666 RepID=A0A655QIU0_VIBCL|nr:Uncharacterised protein [Vibrio cholerae]CSA74374.1 Uncharacterised protein [Vibrio cholerae]CSB54312.1 Uncharacterised protein [Vibrio cholerae]CSB83265.1 Uncharacterised protein [Vibrio cholerae]CSC20929.1 Uncharacterised protein [Vibrio cholerae]